MKITVEHRDGWEQIEKAILATLIGAGVDKEKMGNLIRIGFTEADIAECVKNINEELDKVTEYGQWYKGVPNAQS